MGNTKKKTGKGKNGGKKSTSSDSLDLGFDNFIMGISDKSTDTSHGHNIIPEDADGSILDTISSALSSAKDSIGDFCSGDFAEGVSDIGGEVVNGIGEVIGEVIGGILD